MKNRQVQILYGISGVQVLGLSIMAGGMEAGSVLAAVGTGILVIYATGLLAKESGRKKCPECGSLILKKRRCQNYEKEMGYFGNCNDGGGGDHRLWK